MEELDLKELMTMFWNKKVQTIIIVLIFGMIGGVYSMFMVTPEYRSSTTLVLAKAEDTINPDNSITQTEITLNQKLVSTYSELIKSKAVLRQVLSNLSITSVSEEDLRRNITVNSVKDTELIEITVSNDNKEYASNMANEIAKVFTAKVTEIYNIKNVYIVDAAEVSNGPYNISHIKDVAIFVAIGIVIAILYVLLSNMLDTTVKTAEEIEKATGILVLATVPKMEFSKSMKEKGGNAEWIRN